MICAKASYPRYLRINELPNTIKVFSGQLTQEVVATTTLFDEALRMLGIGGHEVIPSRRRFSSVNCAILRS